MHNSKKSKMSPHITTFDFDAIENPKENICSNSLIELAKKIPLLSPKEEKALLNMRGTSQWDSAKEKLIVSNLRLVISIAKKYKWVEDCEFEDIVMYGIIGLMKAINRFDQTYKTKLSTYATYWINLEIQSELVNKRGVIQIPSYMRRTASILWRLENQMIQEGLSPTYKMLAQRSGIPLKKVIKTMEALSLSVTSMNVQIGDDDEFGDMIASPACVEETAIRNVAIKQVFDVVNKLTRTEQRIISLRYGFEGGGKPLTLSECSKKIGKSPERCRQIQNQTIWKIQKKVHAHV